MKVDNGKLALLDKHTISDEIIAYSKPANGFEKLMAYYMFGKLVWAHKELIPTEPEKPKKKRLTKRNKKVQ